MTDHNASTVDDAQRTVRVPWSTPRRLALGAMLIAAAAVVVHLHRAAPVASVRVARRPIVETIVASGRIEPAARVKVGALAHGVVREVRFREGQHVEAHDVLLALDDGEARAALVQADANVGLSAARLRQLEGLTARLANERLSLAALEARNAETELARTDQLIAAGAMPASQREDAERSMARATEQLNAAKLQVDDTGRKGAARNVIGASLTGARGAKMEAELRLGRTRVEAPCSGTLLRRDAEVGDIIEAGHVAFVLACDGAVRVVTTPDERVLPLLRLGLHATAVSDAFPNDPFDAVVDYVAPSIDRAKGTIEVKLSVSQAPSFLRCDMTVSITIRADERPAALVVPPDAIHDADSAAPWVMLVRNGKPQRKPVRLGLRNARDVEVVEGLQEGDDVALAVTPTKSNAKIHPWD